MWEPPEMTRHDSSERHFMELALEQARLAAEHGDVPIGAVLVDAEGQVRGRGRNRREERGDPTAHAEIEALRDASGYDGWRREGSTMFVTLEPCPMCMGALVNARVTRVVYGAADRKAGAAKTLYRIGEDARLNHRVLVTDGLMEEECRELLQSFFKELRRRSRG